jgi:hypothetical protein
MKLSFISGVQIRWQNGNKLYEECLNLCAEASNNYKLIIVQFSDVSRDSAVGIATAYGLDDLGDGVRVPVGSRISSSLRRPDRFLGPTQPPIQWVRGALSPGVKRQGREADHSPPVSAEVKKMWLYTSTRPYKFMA